MIRRKCTEEFGNGVGNWMSDNIINGLDRISYGNGPSHKSYNTYYNSSIRTYPPQQISYNNVSSQVPFRQPEQSPMNLDFRDITTMRDRASAADLLYKMRYAIDKYDNVSVCELLEAVGMADDVLPYTYNDYGWTNLDGVEPRSGGFGWWLPLPPPKPLR